MIVINPAHAHRREVGQEDNSEEAGRPPDPLPPTGCGAWVSVLGVGCHFLRHTRDARTNSRALAAERSVLRLSLQRIQGTTLLKVATLCRNRQKGVGFVEQSSNADAVGLHERSISSGYCRRSSLSWLPTHPFRLSIPWGKAFPERPLHSPNVEHSWLQPGPK